MDRCPLCGKWTPGIGGKFCTSCFLGMGGQAPGPVIVEVQGAELRTFMGELGKRAAEADEAEAKEVSGG